VLGLTLRLSAALATFAVGLCSASFEWTVVPALLLAVGSLALGFAPAFTCGIAALWCFAMAAPAGPDGRDYLFTILMSCVGLLLLCTAVASCAGALLRIVLD
jgi:hypothetical protein